MTIICILPDLFKQRFGSNLTHARRHRRAQKEPPMNKHSLLYHINLNLVVRILPTYQFHVALAAATRWHRRLNQENNHPGAQIYIMSELSLRLAAAKCNLVTLVTSQSSSVSLHLRARTLYFGTAN